MKAYLEAVLHQDINIKPFEATSSQLPLVLRRGYRIFNMVIGSHKVLLAEPVDAEPLVVLKKNQKQIEAGTGRRCVLSLNNMSSYARNALVKEGIPFIWKEHQLYLPFLGMLLDSSEVRNVPQCDKIAFLTQKLLLTAIYQRWEQVTVTKAAAMLGVTKTAVSHSFDELESLHIPYLSVKNRARKLTISANRKEVWETIKEYLRNPVIATYSLKDRPVTHLITGGLTALSKYSLLNEPTCLTLAVSKKSLSGLQLTKNHFTHAEEEPACILQEIGYQIDFEKGEAIDPLSLVLSLTEDEKEDPRISMSVDEMLERYVW